MRNIDRFQDAIEAILNREVAPEKLLDIANSLSPEQGSLESKAGKALLVLKAQIRVLYGNGAAKQAQTQTKGAAAQARANAEQEIDR